MRFTTTSPGVPTDHRIHSQRQHVVVVEDVTALVHDRQAIAVGILRKADLGSGVGDELGSCPSVSRRGSGTRGNGFVGSIDIAWRSQLQIVLEERR